MAVEVIQGEDAAAIDAMRRQRVTILGFGNQGRAHAENLRDSGISVTIGARPDGHGWNTASRAGYGVQTLADACHNADLIIIALPDEVHASVWDDVLADVVQPGQTLGFIHGFSIRFDCIRPDDGIGVIMVAPKGPGATLRWRFQRGEGIPALIAVHRESSRGNAESLMLGWANAIGCARAALLRATFAAEAESDLFGEQAVLCGGMLGLIRSAFDVLVDAGYPPEVAYIECCHELKQVADLVYERGLLGMTQAISNTAEFGAYEAAGVIADEATRDRLRAILADVRNGAFAQRMMADHAGGAAKIESHRRDLAGDQIEQASATVRSYMPFLQQGDTSDSQ